MAIEYQFNKKRFEAFIDAIIAILLTILVLEIKVPENKSEDASTFEQVKSLSPYLFSYFISFMLIVSFWIDYHLLFENISHITKRFIIINMLFILSLSFTPFVTAFAGKHSQDSFAVALLSSIYFITNLFFTLVFYYAKINNLTNQDFWKGRNEREVFALISFVAIPAAIPLAYVNTYISFAIFLIIFSGQLIKKKW